MRPDSQPQRSTNEIIEGLAQGYTMGFNDSQAKKYPGATRAEVAEEVIDEILGSREAELMTERVKMQTAVLRALDRYVQRLGFAPDLRPEVRQDTYPGLLEGNGYSPMSDRAFADFRSKIVEDEG